MKKLMVVLMALLLLCGCSSEKKPEEPATLGQAVLSVFRNETSDDKAVLEIAEKILEAECIEFNGFAMEAEEGYLNGFTCEIHGFNEGAVFSPMISSIPFIGYVFRTDDTEGLMKELREHADMRWNICTEADEMIVESKGSTVFFLMCPKTMED